MSITRRLWLVPVMLVIMGALGCGTGAVRREVEKSVAATLPELIGPADSYTVSAYGSNLEMVKGRIDRVHIVGTNVKLKDGPVVARLLVDIEDLVVDTGSRKIRRAGGTTYTADITQQALTRYVAAEYPDIYDLAVVLEHGEARVSAKPGLAALSARVQASAKIEVRRERVLALDLNTLRVAGVNTPGIARDFIASRFGTIYDASKLGYDARIKSVTVAPGMLRLTGSLDLTKPGPAAS